MLCSMFSILPLARGELPAGVVVVMVVVVVAPVMVVVMSTASEACVGRGGPGMVLMLL